jgi:hypothetical protein
MVVSPQITHPLLSAVSKRFWKSSQRKGKKHHSIIGLPLWYTLKLLLIKSKKGKKTDK